MIVNYLSVVVAVALTLSGCGGGESNSETDNDIDAISFEMLDATDVDSISLPDTARIPLEEEPVVEYFENDDENRLVRLAYSNGVSVTGKQLGNLLETTISGPGKEDLVVLNDERGRGVLVSSESGAQVQYYYDEGHLLGARLRDLSGREFVFSFDAGVFSEVEDLALGFDTTGYSLSSSLAKNRTIQNTECLTPQRRELCDDLMNGLSIGFGFSCRFGGPYLCSFVGGVTAGHYINCTFLISSTPCGTPPPVEPMEEPIDPQNPYNCSEDSNAIQLYIYRGATKSFRASEVIAIRESKSIVSYIKEFNVSYSNPGDRGLGSSEEDVITYVLNTKRGVDAELIWSFDGELSAERVGERGKGWLAANAYGPKPTGLIETVAAFWDSPIQRKPAVGAGSDYVREIVGPTRDEWNESPDCESKWLSRAIRRMSVSAGHNNSIGTASAIGTGRITAVAKP